MTTKKIILSHNQALLEILNNSFFQREGFELILLGEDETGIEQIELEAPCMAIFDLTQMGEQALESCRILKADPLLSITPLLLLPPQQANSELADACWAAGCDAIVEQPLVADKLLDAACKLLGISRRLARRFPVNFQLELLDSKQKSHAGSCINLNNGGMYLATETLFPMDTIMQLEFTLPGLRSALSCQVRVAWINHPEWRKKLSLPCGMGVQFVGMSPSIKIVLQDFLNRMNVAEQN